ncbi:hypothetical protein BSFA1_41820 [Burkholderia sp. SFA1]|nr:hypothetical protein BSFA1_41820 [Burkholderia sp. SFA1]
MPVPVLARRGEYEAPPPPVPKLRHTRTGGFNAAGVQVMLTVPVAVAREVVAGEIEPKVTPDVVAVQLCACAVALSSRHTTNSTIRFMASHPRT